MSCRAKLFHVMLEKALDLTGDRQELAIEIEKVLWLRIATANDQCIRAPDKRIAGIDAMCPAFERAAWLLQGGQSEAA
jgi:hypothetical protein